MMRDSPRAEKTINEINEFIEELNPFKKFKLISKCPFPLLCENINNKIEQMLYYEITNTPIIINTNILLKYYNMIYDINSYNYYNNKSNKLCKMYIYYVCNISKKVPYGNCYKSILKILHCIFRPLKYDLTEEYIEKAIEKFEEYDYCKSDRICLPSIIDKETLEIFKNIFIKENLKWR